jgi:hypothetical protein
MTDTFYIKQGDLLPDLTFTLKDVETGTPINLTDATLAFHMKNRDGVLVINRAANVDGDPLLGKGRFVWQAGDTATAGRYEAEVETIKNGKPLTMPNAHNFPVIIAPAIA